MEMELNTKETRSQAVGSEDEHEDKNNENGEEIVDNNQEEEECEEDEGEAEVEGEDEPEDDEDGKEEKVGDNHDKDKDNVERLTSGLLGVEDDTPALNLNFTTRSINTKELPSHFKKDSNKGLTGLQNVGNSCYLNCSLQCLSSNKELVMYFLSGAFKEEINPKSKLKGKVSELFADIFNALWVGNAKKYNPSDLKFLMSKLFEQFTGDKQQDAHEMFVRILEVLSDEFNKSSGKPYEAIKERLPDEKDPSHSQRIWDYFAQRENSIVTDFYQGLLKTTINCQECHKQSISFDPFTTLSLPIPKLKRVEVTLIPLSHIRPSVTLSLFIPEETLFMDLPRLINYYTTVKFKKLRFMLINGNDSAKMIKSGEPIYKLSRKGQILCYEIDSNHDTSDYYTPICYFKDDEGVYNTYPKMFPVSNQMSMKDFNLTIYAYLRRFFDLPESLDIPKVSKLTAETNEAYLKGIREEYSILFSNSTSAQLKESVEKYLSVFPYEVYIHQITTEKDKTIREEKVVIFDGNKREDKFSDSNRVDELVNSIKKGNRIIINIKKDRIASERLSEMNACLVIKPNGEKETSLKDCLQFFSSTEKFDRFNEWYCSSCKKTQQAYKRTEIFYAPKYLVLNLKRYDWILSKSSKGKGANNSNSAQPAGAVKNETNVTYPLTNLNLNETCGNHYSNKDVFELTSVVQHYGSQAGGHYSTICKQQGEWYEFNDNSVFKTEEQYVTTSSAYMLIYKKVT